MPEEAAAGSPGAAEAQAAVVAEAVGAAEAEAGSVEAAAEEVAEAVGAAEGVVAAEVVEAEGAVEAAGAEVEAAAEESRAAVLDLLPRRPACRPAAGRDRRPPQRVKRSTAADSPQIRSS